MNRTIGAAIAIAALAIAPSAAQAAPEDFTSGSAWFECQQDCGAHVSWTGHGTPADARGQAHIIQPYYNLNSKATVDCVKVDGNRATISGRVEEPPAGSDGEYYAIQVEDNGPGRLDRVSVGYIFRPIDCTFGNEFPPTFEASRGNAEVKDRTP